MLAVSCAWSPWPWASPAPAALMARSPSSTTELHQQAEWVSGGGCCTSKVGAGACRELARIRPSLRRSSNAAGCAPPRPRDRRGPTASGGTSLTRFSRRMKATAPCSMTGMPSTSAIVTVPPLPMRQESRACALSSAHSLHWASLPPPTSSFPGARPAPWRRRSTRAPCSGQCPGPSSLPSSTLACSQTGPGQCLGTWEVPRIRRLANRRPTSGRWMRSCGGPSRSGTSRRPALCPRRASRATPGRPGSACSWSTCCPSWRCRLSYCSRASTPPTCEASTTPPASRPSAPAWPGAWLVRLRSQTGGTLSSWTAASTTA
mmetsp:Transcript_98785/g.304450  ORF Transcript_98785/g.304450 Transcript_98785/m.304450 type:complete len:318 (+) Transcript_98785:766-1719(+)